MNSESLYAIAANMMTKGKGILAADESNRTATKRLESIGMESTEETRRQYRDLFLMTPEIETYLSGVIFYDETLRQSASDGTPFLELVKNKGIVPGIKVDMGAKDFSGFPDEKVTEGLDGLPARLEEYAGMGAQFTKWRAVIRIGDGIPTLECIHTNATILARYARMVQDAGMVPIVEPEVLLEGTHDMKKAEEVITQTLSEVFYQIVRYRGDLKATILKTSMVVPGSESGGEMIAGEVAEATVRALRASVPDDVAGVVFLSGGQTPEQARDNLNAIAKRESLPWEIAFSYARALQGPALKMWGGKEENVEAAREEFLRWLKMDTQADLGTYVIEK